MTAISHFARREIQVDTSPSYQQVVVDIEGDDSKLAIECWRRARASHGVTAELYAARGLIALRNACEHFMHERLVLQIDLPWQGFIEWTREELEALLDDLRPFLEEHPESDTAAQFHALEQLEQLIEWFLEIESRWKHELAQQGVRKAG